MDKVRVGIIGAGFMGRTNAETATRYLDGAELVAIAGGTRAPQLAREYCVAHDPTVAHLLERSDIDAVLISTPHSEHASQAILAAEHGKHILLDKPMATTLGDCDQILAAVDRAGVNLMIMFGQRFRICNREAHRLIQEGAIGRVRMIRELILNCGGLGSLPSWQRQPANSGTLLAHGVHNIDRIRWFSGQEISSVAAQVQYDAASGNEVSAMAVFGLSDGAMATLWESWAIPEPGFPYTASSSWVVGESGILDVDAYGELRLGREGRWTVVARQDPIDWKGKGMLDPVRLEAYRLQHQEFINSIREGREPAVSGKDGRAAVEVALAAYRSAADRVTVRLPMGG
ncbi:MAG: Gfo/Idh/MocA family oxidoreductase [Acidobacteria bacterium]|nr:Gfo/Idh/MocA family oxidoreductase [Acidobacteriota bacterium]